MLLYKIKSIGFSGSRAPTGAAVEALCWLLSVLPVSGVRVSVGCADGVDRLVRAWSRSFEGRLLFSVASGRWGSGRSAFARRSVALVRSVSPRSGVLVCVPSSPTAPVRVRPSRSFYGGGSGSWGACALALGLGRSVLLWLPSGCLPPAWLGVAWSVSASSGPFSGVWWFGCPAPPQLSLFS
jgi:hypothetical protein